MKVQAYFHTLGVQVCAEQNWTCRGLCHMGEPWTESDTLLSGIGWWHTGITYKHQRKVESWSHQWKTKFKWKLQEKIKER